MDCYCEGGSCSPRAFLTKDEKVERLKEYKSALDKESKGVSERIAELENK